MSNVVTARACPKRTGTRGLCILQRPEDAEVGRRRIQGYAEGSAAWMAWRPSMPTAPSFGHRRRDKPSAPVAIPVVSL
jgi:hypothetical protein